MCVCACVCSNKEKEGMNLRSGGSRGDDVKIAFIYEILKEMGNQPRSTLHFSVGEIV